VTTFLERERHLNDEQASPAQRATSSAWTPPVSLRVKPTPVRKTRQIQI
jgi:hypothetical protein